MTTRFRMPDIQSPMDIAALIWVKSDFYIAMIEEPEAVRELAEKVRCLLTAFLDEWFRRYGTGYVAHFPTYWMEGGLTLSEDEVGAVNPAMFDTFFLPELEAHASTEAEARRLAADLRRQAEALDG